MRIRIATYNASLSRERSQALLYDIHHQHAQIDAVCRILAHLDADILLLNEFDTEPPNAAAIISAFLDQLHQHFPAQRTYQHVFSAPVNTGILSPIDFGQDGKLTLPVDGYGFGRFPGNYGMLLLSRLPIDHAYVRTFQHFLWRDLPGCQLPHLPGAPNQSYFSPTDLDQLRLSSKSHWDIPIILNDQSRLHCLCAHPTPPAFDGAERRNRYRNADEIRFWTQYLSGNWVMGDDQGQSCAFEGDYAVVLGDLNNDPHAGDGDSQAIQALLAHPRLQDPQPYSRRFSTRKPVTADFTDQRLRVDYVLPDAKLNITDCGVLWPAKADPDNVLFRINQQLVSDHYPVWVDIDAPLSHSEDHRSAIKTDTDA